MGSSNITVHPLPNVDAGIDQSICLGENITLSGANANSYVWDNGVTDGTPFNPASTINYTVTGTDINGCVNTDNITVTVNPLDDASYSYSLATYCLTGADPSPTITGLPGGSFTATGGIFVLFPSYASCTLDISTIVPLAPPSIE